MRGGEGRPAGSPPCRRCRHWDPRVVTDGLGIVRALSYCSREKYGEKSGYSCFAEELPREEEREPPADERR